MEVDENNINQVIAKNLKIARQVKVLTLKDVGAILGIKGQADSKI